MATTVATTTVTATVAPIVIITTAKIVIDMNI
jgi:hypothetical protein